MNAWTGPVENPGMLFLAASSAAGKSVPRAIDLHSANATQPARDPAAADVRGRRSRHDAADEGTGVMPALTAAEVRSWTKAIRRGDEAAFTRFHDRYSLRLYRYLLVLSRGDELEARDVAQIVIVKIAQRFEVFDEERRLWAWLCRLARNAYIDRWRSHRRQWRFVSLEQADPPPGVTEFGSEELWPAALQQVLQQLPEADQELLHGAYVDGRPLQEIAKDAGLTYKALESRLGRLRKKLKTALLTHLRHERAR